MCVCVCVCVLSALVQVSGLLAHISPFHNTFAGVLITIMYSRNPNYIWIIIYCSLICIKGELLTYINKKRRKLIIFCLFIHALISFILQFPKLTEWDKQKKAWLNLKWSEMANFVASVFPSKHYRGAPIKGVTSIFDASLCFGCGLKPLCWSGRCWGAQTVWVLLFCLSQPDVSVSHLQ